MTPPTCKIFEIDQSHLLTEFDHIKDDKLRLQFTFTVNILRNTLYESTERGNSEEIQIAQNALDEFMKNNAEYFI